MPEFLWLQGPPYGSCFGCGTSANDRGFVQTFADVDVRQDGQVVGIADVFFCAHCLYSMGNLVGTATPQQTEDFARREIELLDANEKLKDEIHAWQQRFIQMSSLDLEDYEKLIQLKESEINDFSSDALTRS